MKAEWKDGKYEGLICSCPDEGECNKLESCKGECGCKACHTAYMDYISSARG